MTNLSHITQNYIQALSDDGLTHARIDLQKQIDTYGRDDNRTVRMAWIIHEQAQRRAGRSYR